MSLGATALAESADANASGALAEPLLTTTQDSDPEACADDQDAATEAPAETAPEGSTLQSTVATLCIGVLGSGQLALPYAVHLLGLAGGMAALGVMGIVAVATLYMLAECREVAQSRCYGGILHHMLGPRCSHVANGLLALYAWGGGVTYLMILGKELMAVVSKLTSGAAAQSLGPNVFMMAAVALCILPLSCFRSLDRLKFTSTLGAAAAVYITLVVSANALSGAISGGPVSPCQAADSNCSSSECEPSGALLGSHDGAPAPLHMWPSFTASSSAADSISSSSSAAFRLWPDLEGLSPFHVLFNIITALAIFGFALNSAWCFVPIISNLRDRTAAKSSALIVSSQTIILLNYVLISVSGYFSFCDATKDDILQNLENSAAVVIARAMLVAQLSFALPLRFSVTRGIISKYVFGEVRDGSRSSWHPESSLPAHLLVTAAIVCSAALVASFAGSISLAMSLASTVCASAISYVFPALCYLQLLNDRRKEQQQQQQQQKGSLQSLRFASTCAILAYGLFMMFVGTGMNVYGAMKGFVVIGG